MRNKKIRSLLPGLLCAAALLAAGCNRGENATPAPAQLAQSQPPAAHPPAPAPPVNELQPPAQAVNVPPPPAPPPPERSGVDARERDLAARAADLDARERRLREREQQKSASSGPPEPPPYVAPSTAPGEAEETAAAPASAEPAPAPAPPQPPRMTTVTVPAGTQLAAELTKTLASNSSTAGETFRARINQDVLQDGVVAIPAGAEIVGEVTEAVPSKKIGGQARLTLKVTDLVLPTGKTVPIDASIVQEGKSKTGRDAATIGGAAAGGAILGRLLSDGSRGKGGVIGALIGAVAGAAIAARTPGEEVVIPQGTAMSLKLDQPVDVRVRAADQD
jgi:type IV secretory pathway VirB10-like protein